MILILVTGESYFKLFEGNVRESLIMSLVLFLVIYVLHLKDELRWWEKKKKWVKKHW